MDVFYINLDRAADRRGFIEAQARSLGLTLQRHRATEPKDLVEGDYERFQDSWERRIAPNELALLRSHAALWRKALDRPRGLVVLEDDVVLSPRFGAVIDRLPAGYDLINLEDFGKRKFFARQPSHVEGAFSVTRVFRDKAGSAAYHVSPAGAAKLLALAERIAAPSDAFVYSAARLTMAQLEPAVAKQAHLLAAQGLNPGIVIASSIHQDRIGNRRLGGRLRFMGRKAVTELRLAGMHLRRLRDAELRAPVLDEAEFRSVLPIRS